MNDNAPQPARVYFDTRLNHQVKVYSAGVSGLPLEIVAETALDETGLTIRGRGPMRKQKNSLEEVQIEAILALARCEKTSPEIRQDTGIRTQTIRRVCRIYGVELRPAKKPAVVEPPKPSGIAEKKGRVKARKAAVHPLVELGRGLRPLEHAKVIMERRGLTTHHGQPWLDGKYATPLRIVQAANRVLKAEGQGQIGGHECWV